MESQVPELPLSAPHLSAPHLSAPQRIGVVAKRSGVSVKTIRFYCDQGLLLPSARSDGGYRLFEDAVYGELALIRMLRALEIPLATIAEVLEARRSGICHCDELRGTIGSKASEIEQRISDLQHLHAELTRLLDSWQTCGGRRPAEQSLV